MRLASLMQTGSGVEITRIRFACSTMSKTWELIPAPVSIMIYSKYFFTERQISTICSALTAVRVLGAQRIFRFEAIGIWATASRAVFFPLRTSPRSYLILSSTPKMISRHLRPKSSSIMRVL